MNQKKREKLSLEKLVDGGTERREAGEQKRTKRKRQTTVLLVEVKPLHPVRSYTLRPIEGEIHVSPRLRTRHLLSRSLQTPAARDKTTHSSQETSSNI